MNILRTREPSEKVTKKFLRHFYDTTYWKMRRKAAMRRAGHVCQECGASDRNLHVHHLSYERIGREHPNDLAVLCNSCHKKMHGKSPWLISPMSDKRLKLKGGGRGAKVKTAPSEPSASSAKSYSPTTGKTVQIPTPAEIAAFRESLGLSVIEFAKRLDVARITVYRWEKGERIPTGLALKALLRLKRRYL